MKAEVNQFSHCIPYHSFHTIMLYGSHVKIRWYAEALQLVHLVPNPLKYNFSFSTKIGQCTRMYVYTQPHFVFQRLIQPGWNFSISNSIWHCQILLKRGVCFSSDSIFSLYSKYSISNFNSKI
jgi:hypothetical protein